MTLWKLTSDALDYGNHCNQATGRLCTVLRNQKSRKPWLPTTVCRNFGESREYDEYLADLYVMQRSDVSGLYVVYKYNNIVYRPSILLI